MKFLTTIVTVVFTLCIANIALAQLNNIEGDWAITEAVVSGQEVPTDILSTMKLKIERGSFDAKSGETMSKGKISNVDRNSPSQILFKIDSGVDSGREVKAIFKMENKNLKIAYSLTSDFPTDFNSTKENRFLVMTYKNTAKPKNFIIRNGKKYPKASISGFQSTTAN